jgi:geranylgeranylglycerol-phosphate geranylgeranyltransferase
MLAGLAVLIGVFIAGKTFHFNGELVGIDWTFYELVRAALAFAAAALVTGAGNAINDYFDRKIDKVNRPDRPIPSGRIKAPEALAISQALFIVGIFLTVFVNVACVLLAALNSLILAFYAAGLKRRGFAGNLAIGYLVGSTFLFGGLVIGEIQAAGILAAMAALSTVGRELVKGIEDMRGDRASGLSTFPVRYGARKAAVLAAAFIAAAVVLAPLPYILYPEIFDLAYLRVVAASIIAFVWSAALILKSQKPKSAGRASLGCKIAMGLGLLAFLAGAIA